MEPPETPVKHANHFVYHIEKILPKNWEVLWSDKCLAPLGWDTENKRDEGVEVHLWNLLGSEAERAAIDVYCMPITWSGKNVFGERIVRGALINRKANNSKRKQDKKFATYHSVCNKTLVFFHYSSLGEWKTAVEDITRAFKKLER